MIPTDDILVNKDGLLRFNDDTVGTQAYTNVAALKDGTYVVTWHTANGDGYDVHARIMNADGTPATDTFLVNTYTTSDQGQPKVVAIDGGERFVIVWQSFGQDGTAEDFHTTPQKIGKAWYRQNGIFGQIYEADGTPVGEEFQVNTTVQDDQWWPHLVALPDGGFVTIWRHAWVDLPEGETDWWNWRAQRFDADGNPVGEEFVLDTNIPRDSGDFYEIGWHFAAGPDDTILVSGNTIYYGYLLKLDMTGAMVQPPTRVVDTVRDENGHNLTGFQDDPTIAILKDGQTVVSAWSNNLDGPTHLGGEIQYRFYDTDLNALSDVMTLPVPKGIYYHIQVIPLEGGGFVLTWMDNDKREIFGQIIDADGNPVGEPTYLTDFISTSQYFDVDVLSNGDLIVVTTGGTADEGKAIMSSDAIGQIVTLLFHGASTGFTDGADEADLSDNGVDISTLDGDDVIRGGAGDDIVRGNGGDDALTGADGNDILFGNAGDDTLIGNAGSDRLVGGDGRDRLEGGWGNDFLYGDDGNDALIGGVGNDVLIGGAGVDFLSGGDGDDLITAHSGDGTWVRRGVVYAGETLDGGAGNDRLIGWHGADTLLGGEGDDYLEGGEGDDFLYGGDGHDTIIATDRGDKAYGGDGDDIVWVSTWGDSSSENADFFADGGAGSNTIAMHYTPQNSLDENYVKLDLSDETDRIENFDHILLVGPQYGELRGNANDNSIIIQDTDRMSAYGGAGNDLIVMEGTPTREGDKRLYGEEGNDTLIGGIGGDVLNGGVGDDLMSGAGGADTFVFESFGDRDVITDFDTADDIIDLGGLVADSNLARIEFPDGTEGVVIRCYRDDLERDETVLRVTYVQDGADTIVTVRDMSDPDRAVLTIELEGVTATDLSDDMFVL